MGAHWPGSKPLPDDEPWEAAAYAATELRGSLSGGRLRLSGRRKLAAMAPLVVSLTGWFSLPALASTFTLGDGGARLAGITSDASTCVWADALGDYRCAPPGQRTTGYLRLRNGDGGSDITAYGLNAGLDDGGTAIFGDADDRGLDPHVAYIVNAYLPVAQAAGELDEDSEASAVQLAIFGFTDNALDPTHPPTGFPDAVVNRSIDIFNDAISSAPDFVAAQAAPAMTVSVSKAPATHTEAVTATALLVHADGSPVNGPVEGSPMVRWVSDGATVNGAATAVDGTGRAVVSVTRRTGGRAHIEATLDGYSVAAADRLVPDDVAAEDVVVAHRHAVESHAGADISFGSDQGFAAPVLAAAAGPLAGVPLVQAAPAAETTSAGSDPPGGSLPLAAATARPAPRSAIPTPSSPTATASALAPSATAPPTATPASTPSATVTPTPAPSSLPSASSSPSPSATECPPPSPVIMLRGPATITAGDSVQYVVTGTATGPATIAQAALVVTVPPGTKITATTPNAVLAGQTATLSGLTVTPGQPVTLAVTAAVSPGTRGGPLTARGRLSGQSDTQSGCRPAQALTEATTTGTVGAPEAAGAVKGIRVGPPPTGSVAAATTLRSLGAPTPTTGIASTAFRSSLGGLGLILSGLVVLGGLRRNPHARFGER